MSRSIKDRVTLEDGYALRADIVIFATGIQKTSPTGIALIIGSIEAPELGDSREPMKLASFVEACRSTVAPRHRRRLCVDTCAVPGPWPGPGAMPEARCFSQLAQARLPLEQAFERRRPPQGMLIGSVMISSRVNGSGRSYCTCRSQFSSWVKGLRSHSLSS